MDTSTVLKAEDFLPYYAMLEEAKAGPARLLTEALALIDAAGTKPGLAVDLGCGTGKDSAELLRHGWKVLAVDFSQEGIDNLLNRPEAKKFQNMLETRVAAFGATSWSGATLVAALLSLPYCPAEKFKSTWDTLVSSLVPGGYFVGQLFGTGQYPGASHIVRCTREEVLNMLSGFTMLKLEEVDREVVSGDDQTRYHYFDIIARKI